MSNADRGLQPIVSLLATSLGDALAETVVRKAADALGLDVARSQDDLLRVLRYVESQEGTSSLAARLAIARLQRNNSVPMGTSAQASLPPQAKRLSLEVLVTSLGRALGDAKAEEVIARAQRAIGITGTAISPEEAAQLLDWLVAQGGAVGTVARFAKVRLLLQKEG